MLGAVELSSDLLSNAGWIGALIALVSAGYVRSLHSTVGVLKESNAALREDLAAQRTSQENERLECAQRISNLEGQVSATQNLIAADIAAKVVALLPPGRRTT
jgi:hypothetical protein